MIRNGKESLGIVFQADAPMISSSYLKKQVSDRDVIIKNYDIPKRKYANFQEIKRKYRGNPLPILRELVGQGRIEGSDYVTLNPRRKDVKLGSFRVDISTGRFHDFATGDRGGSVIDLAMFVYNCGIVEAAQRLEDLFPFLARQPLAVQEILAKKKRLDVVYIWNKSKKAQHQYLDIKKISIGNARVNLHGGDAHLVIPLVDIARTTETVCTVELKGLQFIDRDGNKSFPLPFKGLFHIASDYERSKDIIVIAEGYATARSIAESTTFCVIAAMSSCNLKNVVKKISGQLPDSRIVIAADNDEAGRNAAQGVSDIPNVQIVYPTQGFKDFNDMYQDVGTEGVRNVFYVAAKEGEK